MLPASRITQIRPHLTNGRRMRQQAMHFSSWPAGQAFLAKACSARPFKRFASAFANYVCGRSACSSAASNNSSSRQVRLGPPVLRRAAHRRLSADESQPSSCFGARSRQITAVVRRSPVEPSAKKNEHLSSSRSGPAQEARPNPSLERTATGKALGPRASQCHHPSRGPSASPAPAAQLKR